jgi:hypothetical protein
VESFDELDNHSVGSSLPSRLRVAVCECHNRCLVKWVQCEERRGRLSGYINLECRSWGASDGKQPLTYFAVNEQLLAPHPILVTEVRKELAMHERRCALSETLPLMPISGRKARRKAADLC